VRDLERIALAVAPRRRVALERHGSEYGGWEIPARTLDERSVVYSGGVGEDATFDLSLIETYGCTVYAFDPTPRAAAYAQEIGDARFVFMPVGIWTSDSLQQFHAPERDEYVSHSIGNPHHTAPSFSAQCRSLDSLMRELGHARVDVLKLDIEGAEHQVLRTLPQARPRTLCVELHRAPRAARIRTLARLVAAGYAVAAADGWDLTLIRSAAAENHTK
jgi:FkbM family methyltransferase